MSHQRNQLIEQHRGIVFKVVSSLMKRFSLPAMVRDELMSAGDLGLVEAARRYNPKSGVKFSTFAFFRVRGAVIEGLRESTGYSRENYRGLKAYRAVTDLRESMLGQEPGPVLSAQAPESQKVLRLAHILEHAAQCAFAVRLAVEDVDQEISLSGETVNDPEKLVVDRDLRSLFKALVSELPSKERKIIEDYYFCEKSFKDITVENPELSKSWVSRLHSRALQQLRARYLEVSKSGEE